MLTITALAIAAVYVLVIVVSALVLARRRRQVPAGDRPSPGPLLSLLIGAVLVAPVVWGVATLATASIVDVLTSTGS
ncbi:hypothetical protein ABC270_08300 [Curtobacterium sp. 1P10AnD]|uniref:hypothetical protein n=1 Tax=Curtobacterium sp. 1P10AnD TaxID=3132283 RepID=UPI0039A056AC